MQKMNADDKLLIDDGNFSQFSHYDKLNSKTPVQPIKHDNMESIFKEIITDYTDDNGVTHLDGYKSDEAE